MIHGFLEYTTIIATITTVMFDGTDFVPYLGQCQDMWVSFQVVSMITY
jgi:hypothetical protein